MDEERGKGKVWILRGAALQEAKDNAARKLFGMTIAEAHEAKVCIRCKENPLPKIYSQAGAKEYGISALCEQCFDEITKEEEGNEED